MPSPRSLLFSAVACALMLISLDAFAVGFQYQILNQKSQTDGDAPILEIEATDIVKSGKVSVKSSSGKSFSTSFGRLNPGARKRLVIKDSVGAHDYEATIEAVGLDGAKATIPIQFKTVRVEPIKLHVDRDAVDVSAGTLIFESNRPIDKVEVELFDKDGKKLGAEEQSFDGQKGKLTLKWTTDGEVGGIQMRAYDVDGFWSALLLEPWWVEIEHQDIIFDFGKSTWQASEEEKLKKSLTEIKKIMKRYDRFRSEMRLYIAGYTDTVGSEGENMKLSAERAEAIAKWFKKQGVEMKVYYQGFGESVLAVQTADNTPEERNRRALYILANSTPPRTKSTPKSNWRAIK